MSVRAPLVAALALGAGLAIAPSPAAIAAPAPAARLGSGCRPRVAGGHHRPGPRRARRHAGAPRRLGLAAVERQAPRRPARPRLRRHQGLRDERRPNDLHDRGYVVVAWSARGHGQSGGRIHLNDPAYEIADARALLDLAAARTDVELDAAGDPRAGVMGASYGGALGLMLAGADRRVDGVVSAITWNDLADAFFPQAAVTAPADHGGRSRPDRRAGPFKQVWATNFFLSGASAWQQRAQAARRAAAGPARPGAAASTRRSAASSSRPPRRAPPPRS